MPPSPKPVHPSPCCFLHVGPFKNAGNANHSGSRIPHKGRRKIMLYWASQGVSKPSLWAGFWISLGKHGTNVISGVKDVPIMLRTSAREPEFPPCFHMGTSTCTRAGATFQPQSTSSSFMASLPCSGGASNRLPQHHCDTYPGWAYSQE